MTEESTHPEPVPTTAPAPDAPEDAGAGIFDLTTLANSLLADARRDPHGRASSVVLRGPRMRSVLMALTSGSGLGEHSSPPAASLHVISGSVRLHSDEQEWVLSSAQIVPIPPDRHAVDALEDSVFLLTVSLDTQS
ncbi:MAG: hypothetical protein ABIU87_12700 [Ornithinibacter sp.]